MKIIKIIIFYNIISRAPSAHSTTNNNQKKKKKKKKKKKQNVALLWCGA